MSAGLPYGGKTFDPARDEARLNEQMVRVYRAMLDESWHSLYELSAATGDPVQSISARLRDLRKADFGGFDIQRRRRVGSDAVWEYRMQPAKGKPSAAKPARRTGFLAGMIYAARIVTASSDLGEIKRSMALELRKAAASKGALPKSPSDTRTIETPKGEPHEPA